MQKRLTGKVFGRVQMVMFRDFVMRNARTRGILGTVKNNPDGTVSFVAESDELKLTEFLAAVRKGSLLSRVDRVEENWSEPLGGYKNFDILYERVK